MGDRHVRGVSGIAIVGVFLAFIAASPASGQVLYGGITGTVTDSTGGTVPAATVTITHKETNLSRETVTNDSGIYTFTNVQAGAYDIKVSLSGFREFLQTNVPVSVNQISRVDVKLDVGALTETVTVQSGGGTAADGQGRRPHRAEVGGNHVAAAQPVPQLSGAHQSRARRHAWCVSERGNGHAGPLALDERQRSESQQQRDAHRRRHQHQYLAAASQRLHIAGRDDRHRQRLDE